MKLNKIYIKPFLVFALVLAGFLSAQAVNAQTSSKSQIIFPISELGNCGSADECKTYCNQLEHVEACTNYGLAHGLINSNDAAAGLKLKSVKTGPGGCSTKDVCVKYCADPANAAECAKFAQDHNLGSSDQVQKFKSFQDALKAGNTPGNCKDEQSCKKYCQDSANAKECSAFAQRIGLIDKAQGDQISKFAQMIANGSTPGGCDTKDACQTYCSNPDHHSECAVFAQRAGLISSEQAKQTGANFVGPGGCSTKDACEAYCNIPANQQACLDFAKARQIIKPSQAQQIKDAGRGIESNRKSITPSVLACLKRVVGDKVAAKIQAGSFTPDTITAQKIRACTEASQAPPAGQPEPNPQPVQPPLPLKPVPPPVDNNTPPNFPQQGSSGGIVPEPFNSDQ